jgi:VanZ family protein
MGKVWIPVLAYVGLIFALSSIPNLAPPTSMSNADKLAHLTEYGILGWLLVRALGRRFPTRPVRAVLGSLLIGAGIAAIDEMYQGTVGRNRDPKDWAADATGILAATLIWLLIQRRRAGRTRDAGILEGRGNA